MNIVNTGRTIKDWLLNIRNIHKEKVELSQDKPYNKDDKKHDKKTKK